VLFFYAGPVLIAFWTKILNAAKNRYIVIFAPVKKATLIILLVLFVDQVLKIWIKTHMFEGQEFHLAGHWAIIHFVENEGMAFGMSLPGGYGKLALSLFRIVAVTGLCYILLSVIKKKQENIVIIAISLIIAGAIGNIIDSAFYGMLFSDSSPYDANVAQFLPAGGGYAGFLHGKVVDMFYFPVLEGHFPRWMPVWGGEEFIFFRPVFNFADSSITVGVIIVILFQKKFFGADKKKTAIQDDDEQETHSISENTKMDAILEEIPVKKSDDKPAQQ
jgi:signal peptidase II